jgi:thiamine-phosphate diphosphorylase
VVRLIVFTDRRQAVRPLPEVIHAAARGGARLVVLREKDLPAPRRAALAVELAAVLARFGGRLLMAGPSGHPAAAGVHLAATDPWPGRPAGLVGRSCHDRAEVAAAAARGAHYATLSPVFPTASKPGYGPPLGPDAFGPDALGGPPLPVYALGGISWPDQARACVAAGAAGVAVMGAVMRASDPAGVVADLLAAATPEPRTAVTS